MDDMVSSEFSSIERDWVIETVYQGAYLRQYHLWEKDCKEYFLSQGEPIPKSWASWNAWRKSYRPASI
jgi:hypothetical protein